MIRSLGQALLAAAMLLAATAAVAQQPLRQVFLVQNSGWMEPFYVDPASPFKALVKDLGQAAAGDQEIVMGGFNQADATHASPSWLYRGPGNHPGFTDALKKLELARKAGGAYADTDFKEALLAAIKVGLEGREGIVWILTNNKNSPNNSAQTREKNREFYTLLHANDVITRIAAFPLRMPVKGPAYQANGLMVYAIAYGEQAGVQLGQVLESPGVRALFKEGPVRLKPLTQSAVAFLPQAVVDAPGVSASLAPDGQTLILDFDADTSPRSATLVGKFENRFYPYEIKSAEAGIDLIMQGGTLRAGLADNKVVNIAPGASSDARITLQLPALPSAWSSEVLLSSGYQMAGEIRVHLTQQVLAVSDQFSARMAELFPGDALPEVFTPPAQAQSSETRLPVVIRIHHPVGPLLILVGLGILLLLGLLIAFFLLSGKKSCTVMVDGVSHKLSLKPFGRVDVPYRNGDKAATVRRGLGKPYIAWRDPKLAVSLR